MFEIFKEEREKAVNSLFSLQMFDNISQILPIPFKQIGLRFDD